MNASAPNVGPWPEGSFGIQVDFVMKSRPEYCRAGHASLSVVARISARIASTSRPAPRLIRAKTRSDTTPPPRRARPEPGPEAVGFSVVWVMPGSRRMPGGGGIARSRLRGVSGWSGNLVQLGKGLGLQVGRQLGVAHRLR